MKTIKTTIALGLLLLGSNSWGQVTVYENNNFSGKSHTYGEGEHYLTPTIGDNVLSSVKVSKGWKVTIQEHGIARTDRGKSIVLTSDVSELESRKFNDIGSTIIVERLGSTNMLNAGQTLTGSKILTSANGKFILRMQEDDGHLCVYNFANGQQGAFVWGSGKHGFKNSKLVMQADGNLVVYDGNNTSKWASDTHPYNNEKFKDSNNKPVKLVLENDGSLKLYTATDKVVWTNK